MKSLVLHVIVSALVGAALFGSQLRVYAEPCDEAMFQEAHKLVTEAKAEEAMELYEQCLQAQPENYSALFWMGYLHYKAGNYRKAADDFNLLAQFYPNDIRARLYLGNARMQLNRLGDAKMAFNDVLSLDSENVPALIGLGWAEYLDGKTFTAVSELKKALALNPDNRSLKRSIDQLETLNDQLLKEEAEERKRQVMSLVGQAMAEAAEARRRAEAATGKKKPDVVTGFPPIADLVPFSPRPGAADSLGVSRSQRFRNSN